MNSVCVYCASSTQIDEKYFRAAEELGALIARKGLRLVTGAGKMGLMCAVEDAALTAGGKVTGIIPSFMIKEGWHHTGLTELIETASMHERKQKMADLSDGAIAEHLKNCSKLLLGNSWDCILAPLSFLISMVITTICWLNLIGLWRIDLCEISMFIFGK